MSRTLGSRSGRTRGASAPTSRSVAALPRMVMGHRDPLDPNIPLPCPESSPYDPPRSVCRKLNSNNDCRNPAKGTEPSAALVALVRTD